jgi:hypothetical protein
VGGFGVGAEGIVGDEEENGLFPGDGGIIGVVDT